MYPHLNWVVGGGDHNTDGGCREVHIGITGLAITCIGSPFVHFDLIAASNPILNTTVSNNSPLLKRTCMRPFQGTVSMTGTYLSRKPAVPYWNALTGWPANIRLSSATMLANASSIIAI